MQQSLDAEVLNESGRMNMVEGYRATPNGSPISEYFKKAEERFKKAHEIDPINLHYLLNIADALFALGKIDEAKKYYSQAAPKMRTGSNHLAGVKRRWGVYLKNETTAELSDAVSTPPASTDSQEDDGNCHNFPIIGDNGERV